MLKSKQNLVSDHLLTSSSGEHHERTEDNDKVILKSMSDITPSNTVNIYIPTIKLAVSKLSLIDKSTDQHQRMHWDALKKSINSKINKINKSNFQFITRELFQDNMIRARGLLARNIIHAQLVSPFYTPVYGALVSFINLNFPKIGELILKRLILIFRHTYQRNDKTNCLSTIKFLSYLIKQNVLHERILLQMLNLLLENTTDNGVELAIELINECKQKLAQVNQHQLDFVFTTLRNFLREASLEKRTKYMIEIFFAERKDQFETNPVIQDDLDLLNKIDQFTHIITLVDTCEPEIILDQFQFDPKYEENEKNYKLVRKRIFDETNQNEDDSSSSNTPEGGETEQVKQQTIIDKTETNLILLHRTIYFTIHTSTSVDECVHKLFEMNLHREQEIELCQMIVDACAQQRTYKHFFGLLAQRFCSLKKENVECFKRIFQDQYETISRLENIKLRNVAKLFAHLLATDAIPWSVLGCIRLTEDDTTSSSRVFIKNLFIELSQIFDYVQLSNRLNDESLQGLLSSDNDKNIRFAIDFFMSIGLRQLTDQLLGCIQ